MPVTYRRRPLLFIPRRVERRKPQVLPSPKTINTYIPVELLREIFLYSLESNHIKSGQLASVCRHWRSVITTLSHLWSTLRVGIWTETEQVATWLQRAYPKKVVIDAQKDNQRSSGALPFSALQNALASTRQWHELTISSFPPENLASQLGIQVASPMSTLKVLHVAAGCAHSPSFSHLLNLVPPEAPLSELRLHPPFASTHFLQPHWFPVLQNLTVLIVSGRDIHEPFGLLPTFTQLQTFEADHLRLPFYELNANLPLLCTLRKLHLRACSVQWMAGREFLRLEECAILLPRHWEIIRQHEVQLPFCTKLTYHAHPMTTARYFHVPKMRIMDLRSHDCNEQRVYQHLRYVCRVDGRTSQLTVLHLTFQCSERVLIRLLKYLIPLQELVLSIAYPSPSWENFLASLAARPPTNAWPASDRWVVNHWKWEEWFSSRTWHTNVLPHLKYLGIQCPKGFSQSECFNNLPLLRLVGWTRAHLTPPLEHLKVWEGRGTTDDTVVEYISTGYLEKHLGLLTQDTITRDFDTVIVMGMVAWSLSIGCRHFKLLSQLHSTVLFRQLQHLEITPGGEQEMTILPFLDQIKSLEIWCGQIPVYSLNHYLPLTHTLHRLKLRFSSFPWMLGRTFKALREFWIDGLSFASRNLHRNEGLQVDLPACTILQLEDCPMDYLRFLSCPNLQTLRWRQFSVWTAFDFPALNSLHDFVFKLSCLQKLYIVIYPHPGLDSLIQFVFCDAWEERIWRDIRTVEVAVSFSVPSWEESHSFIQMVGHQRDYEKWWKELTVTEDDFTMKVTVRGSV